MPISKRINHNYRIKRTQRKRRTWFFSFLFGVLLALTFFYFKDSLFNKKDKISADAKIEVPTSESEAVAVSVKSTDEVLVKIEEYLVNQKGEYGYQITEIGNGITYGARYDNRYTAASTIKVPIAAYLFKQIELGKVDPEKKLTFTNADYEEGTGILMAYPVGSTFKISYLAEVMLSKSDNIATNMLLRYLGSSNIQYFLNQNGLPQISVNENTVTPSSMNKILLSIENRQIVNDASATKILGFMTGSLDSARIVAGVPSNISVAHKVGTAAGAVSDIGIVYLGEKKYIISVYSKKVLDEVTPKNVIKNISKMVYSFESTR